MTNLLYLAQICSKHFGPKKQTPLKIQFQKGSLFLTELIRCTGSELQRFFRFSFSQNVKKNQKFYEWGIPQMILRPRTRPEFSIFNLFCQNRVLRYQNLLSDHTVAIKKAFQVLVNFKIHFLDVSEFLLVLGITTFLKVILINIMGTEEVKTCSQNLAL